MGNKGRWVRGKGDILLDGVWQEEQGRKVLPKKGITR